MNFLLIAIYISLLKFRQIFWDANVTKIVHVQSICLIQIMDFGKALKLFFLHY